jgi:D-sedoheptulose 7-phosphate isomerase
VLTEPCFSATYLAEAAAVMAAVDREAVERLALGLAGVRERGGRVFAVGAGGSAANASHAVSDLRTLCGIEAYAPTDNVAELTARVNDSGWDTALPRWLRGSRLAGRDALLVLSVGGGDRERGVSAGIVGALELARDVCAAIFAIVGRDGGAAARCADAAVVIPPLFAARVTPHTESICAVLWHLLVSHPLLCRAVPRWESIAGAAR